MEIKSIGTNPLGNIKVAYNLLGQPAFMRGLLSDEASPMNGVYAYNNSVTAQAALKLRTDAVAQPKLCLYSSDGKKIKKHPILDLLQYVNDDDNYSDLMKKTESNLVLFPYAAWLKGRETVTGQGKVRQLFPLNSLYLQVVPQVTTDNQVLEWYYLYTPLNGKTERYEKIDLVYFKGQYNPNWDYIGKAPLATVKNACLAERYVSEYLNTFFQNGAMPGLVFTSENPIGKEDTERISKGFSDNFGGVRNFFKTLYLLGNGLKPQTIGWNVKDLDLTAVRAELIKEICRAVRVPEILIHQSNAADLTPVAQAESIFWNMTIKPQLSWYAEVLNNNLLTEFPDLVLSGAYLEFEVDEIIGKLTVDKSKHEESVLKIFQAGLINDEAARRELGYDDADAPVKPVPVIANIDNGTAMPIVAPGTSQTADSPADSTKSDDLSRYERKALKALKDGKSPNVKFESEDISADQIQEISNRLANCKTADEVKAAFKKPDTKQKEISELVTATIELANAIRETNTR